MTLKLSRDAVHLRNWSLQSRATPTTICMKRWHGTSMLLGMLFRIGLDDLLGAICSYQSEQIGRTVLITFKNSLTVMIIRKLS